MNPPSHKGLFAVKKFIILYRGKNIYILHTIDLKFCIQGKNDTTFHRPAMLQNCMLHNNILTRSISHHFFLCSTVSPWRSISIIGFSVLFLYLLLKTTLSMILQ